MNVNVDVFCGRENFSVSEEEIAAVVACLRESAPWKFPAGTLSVAFLGDDEICRMHEEFLSDPSKTDVITFPGDDVFSEPRLRLIPGEGGPDNLESDEDAFAGEICVCVDQAMRIAKELNIAPADELLLYLVHGWLHLAGLDDIEERDRRAMREAEALVLDLLRAHGLSPLRSAAFPQ